MSRADLIADGDLIEPSTEDARDAGWRIPVALTRAAHADAVEWNGGPLQDEAGRWWDVLWMGALAAQNASRAGLVGPRPFRFLRVPNRPRARVARMTTLVLHPGPGDDGEPVITIAALGEAL